MKTIEKTGWSFLIILFPFLIINAQQIGLDDVQVKEKVIDTDDVPMDAWTFKNAISYEELSKHFDQFSKKRHEQKVKKQSKNIWMATEILDVAISSRRADIKLVYLEDQKEVGLIFLMGYDYWANSIDFPSEMDAFRAYAIDFQEFHYQQNYLDEIEEVNKGLKKNQKTFNGLVAESCNLSQRIANSESKLEALNGKKKAKLELKLAQDQSRLLQIEKEQSELSPKIENATAEIDQQNALLLGLENTFQSLRSQYESSTGN